MSTYNIEMRRLLEVNTDPQRRCKVRDVSLEQCYQAPFNHPLEAPEKLSVAFSWTT